MITDFRGTAKKLEDVDIPRIASKIGVGEDELHAFMDVESRGSGFDDQGRPKILFEPHKFYRHLSGAKRNQAIAEGLACKSWGQISYGKESVQYDRLKRAIAIDYEAALKSCSWGLTQIMGENYKMIGYDSVEAMVKAFMEDEDNHLEAAVEFIIAAGIDDDLKAHRWAVVARVYNGPGYRKNKYDTKMAERFAWWQNRKDTEWKEQPSVAENPVADTPMMDNAQVEALQKRLRDLGYFEVGKVDKLWGPRTIAAITAFQAQEGLQGQPGVESPVIMRPWVDEVTLRHLSIASKRPVSPARSTVTADDLVAQGSSTVINSRAINWASILQIAMAVFESIVIAYNSYTTTNLPFGSELFLKMAGTPSWLLPIAQFAFALYSVVKSNKVIQGRINSEISGMHNGEPDPAPSPPVEHEAEPSQGLRSIIRGGRR